MRLGNHLPRDPGRRVDSVFTGMESTIQRLIEEAHAKYRGCREGSLADYIPELTQANPDWFAISLFTVDGQCYEVGDHHQLFTIQSVSKIFTYGMILDDLGFQEVDSKIGVEPSGDAFNSISLDPQTGRPLNPMINAGAIAAVGQVHGTSMEARFNRILKKYQSYTARNLTVDESVYRSESATGFRNRAIANLLRNFNIIGDPVDETIEVYFKQCSIQIHCTDLALMGATLANGGINPITKRQVIRYENVERVLSVMSTCGMYDSSGEWIVNVGLPAKSGVGGGVVGVLPGQLGFAVFSPLLDPKGNSVRGLKTFADLSRRFNLHLFNFPTISDYNIRRVSRLNQMVSQRVRPPDQQAVLAREGEKVVVIELQGDLFFCGMERLLRLEANQAANTELFILDFKRVSLIDRATRDLLLQVARDLAAANIQLWIIDPNKLLTEHIFQAGGSVILIHKSLSRALEACERDLLEKHGAGICRNTDVPIQDFEIFQGLSPDELEIVVPMLERREFERRSRIMAQGEEADYIYMLAKGSVSVRLEAVRGQEGSDHLATYYPGATFGDMAVVDRSKRSAYVFAEEYTVCQVLSVDRFHDLARMDPILHTKILKNLLQMNANRLRHCNQEIQVLREQ